MDPSPSYRNDVLDGWFETTAGKYLLDWERVQVDAAVTDIFGYHAVQLGLRQLDGLRCNRMPHQWQVDEFMPAETAQRPSALLSNFSALPFPASSLDLVVAPHTLEFSADPHATLREIERVLVPEGRLVVCGLNPASLWGLRQRRAQLYRKFGFGRLFFPEHGDLIGYWRLRDWLRLLGLEPELSNFGCYRPGISQEKWFRRFEWMDGVGARWWPILGAAYFLVAVKRVRGMRLIGPSWKSAPLRAVRPVSVARRGDQSPMHRDSY
jgi:SAM-dependent methyltransferase